MFVEFLSNRSHENRVEGGRRRMESEALGHNEISITYGGGRAHFSSENPPYLEEQTVNFNLNHNRSEKRRGGGEGGARGKGFDKLRYI